MERLLRGQKLFVCLCLCKYGGVGWDTELGALSVLGQCSNYVTFSLGSYCSIFRGTCWLNIVPWMPPNGSKFQVRSLYAFCKYIVHRISETWHLCFSPGRALSLPLITSISSHSFWVKWVGTTITIPRSLVRNSGPERSDLPKVTKLVGESWG